MNEFLEAAIKYHDMGLSVVALQPRDKMPIGDWAEYSMRRASVDEIRAWWQEYPRANVGIVTGRVSNLIAIDVDVDRGGDPNLIFEMAPTGLISRTGGGGYHLLYTYDDAIPKNRVGKEDGIDIRSNGGLIVVPPSIHANGKSYSWIKYERVGKVTPSLAKYFAPDKSSLPTQEERWLTDALAGVTSGNRNDTCAKLAGYYAGKGIPKDVAIAMLQNWNLHNNPPLSVVEITTTVNSVYRTAYRYTPPATASQQPTGMNSFDIVGINEYMVTYGENAVTWLIPEWLPEQTIAFAVSPPGTYKTWLLLDLAVSIATGTDFLGQFPVDKSGPVILIQQEDHHGGLAERLATIINSRYHMIDTQPDDVFEVSIPPDIPIFFHTERKLKFNNEVIMDELEKAIDKIRPALVIIDPLYSAAETDDYMAKSASQMFRLKGMRDKYGCAFILAHHRKKKAEGNEREGAWGSQFLNAFLETGWQIRSVGETSISILRHFKVKKATAELNVQFNIDTETFPTKYEVTFREEADEREIDIIELLRKEGPLNPTEISAKIGGHRSTISRRLKLLEADRMVIKNQDGRFQLLSTVEF